MEIEPDWEAVSKFLESSVEHDESTLDSVNSGTIYVVFSL